MGDFLQRFGAYFKIQSIVGHPVLYIDIDIHAISIVVNVYDKMCWNSMLWFYIFCVKLRRLYIQ